MVRDISLLKGLTEVDSKVSIGLRQGSYKLRICGGKIPCEISIKNVSVLLLPSLGGDNQNERHNIADWKLHWALHSGSGLIERGRGVPNREGPPVGLVPSQKREEARFNRRRKCYANGLFAMKALTNADGVSVFQII